MPNIWYKQAYVQGFYCEYISFKKYVNMFEQMDIAESIYKSIVEPSYKKSTREYSNHAGHIRKKRGEAASSQTHPAMDESAGKRRKQYVDWTLGKSKICLIHSPGLLWRMQVPGRLWW